MYNDKKNILQSRFVVKNVDLKYASKT